MNDGVRCKVEGKIEGKAEYDGGKTISFSCFCVFSNIYFRNNFFNLLDFGWEG